MTFEYVERLVDLKELERTARAPPFLLRLAVVYVLQIMCRQCSNDVRSKNLVTDSWRGLTHTHSDIDIAHACTLPRFLVAERKAAYGLDRTLTFLSSGTRLPWSLMCLDMDVRFLRTPTETSSGRRGLPDPG